MNNADKQAQLETLDKAFRRGIVTEEEYRQRYFELTGVEVSTAPKPKHNQLPFTFDGWDGAGEEGDWQFYQVEWIGDWGPLREGEKYDVVAVMLSTSEVQLYIGGQVVNTIKFGFTPA